MTETIPQVLEGLIARAESAGASDLHLQMESEGASVSLRLDGLLAPFCLLEKDVAERVIGRVKYLARLKSYQNSLPQDGRINAAEIGARHDLRVATYPTLTGEKVVLRLFEGGRAVHRLSDLGFPEPALASLQSFLQGPSGLLLLTGPAGSGKTTTIYACLRELLELGGRHIITIEDPAEQVIPGVMQTETNEALGLDFAKAAKHLLRQDPQVLVIGEIRDEETASLVVRAALTGHMVISTLHAGSCRGMVERLWLLCRDHYAAASALSLAVNQRLVRRLCGNCRGEGCDSCLKTGYRGRVPVVEWVRMDDTLRTSLREQGSQGITPTVPFDVSARRLISEGVTSMAELKRVLVL